MSTAWALGKIGKSGWENEGEASQGKTKLITRRGNVITKIFSPSSAACQGNKMPFVKRCPTERISSGQAQGKSLISLLWVCVFGTNTMPHTKFNDLWAEAINQIELIKTSLNCGAVQQRPFLNASSMDSHSIYH